MFPLILTTRAGHHMPTFGPFTVVGSEIQTGVTVQSGDTLVTTSTGTVDFGGAVLGVGAPILNADGDGWSTPSDYPASNLKKNSLIVRFGSGAQWFQGGTNARIAVPLGHFGEVFLRTNDKDTGDNSRGWTVMLEVTSPPPPPPGPPTPNLKIVGIEPVQSLQRADRSMRLIRNKRTMIRAFVDSGLRDGTDVGAGPNRWPNVRGELTVSDAITGGVFASALTPLNQGGVITARPTAQIDRNSGDHSLNFLLPMTALLSGALRVTVNAFVQGKAGQPFWSTSDSTTFGFAPMKPAQEISPLLITYVPPGGSILPPPVGGPPLSAPPLGAFFTSLAGGALPRFPMATDGFRVNPPIRLTTSQPLFSVVGWATLLTQIATMIHIGGPSGGIRAGLVAPSATYPVGGIGAPRVWPALPSFVVTAGDPPGFAHEMGHAFSLYHAPCNGTEPAPIDGRLPADGRTDEVGVDVMAGRFIPTGSAEVMSYCLDGLQWSSVATYNLVYDRIPI